MKKLLFLLSLTLAFGVAGFAQDSALIVDENDKQLTAHALVFGGTGRLGSDIVKALLKDGHKVTVFVRQTSNRGRLEGLGIQYVIGDVLDLKSVLHATRVSGANVAIDALARGSSGPEFYHISAKNIVAGAVRAKLDQIILHGSIGAGESAAVYADLDLNSGMQTLMAAKTTAEQFVQQSKIAYTIIRNGHLIAYGTPATGKAELYLDQTITGSVTRLGLARLTELCMLNTDCYRKTYHAIDKSLDRD